MVGISGVSGASLLPISSDKTTDALSSLDGVGSNPSLILDSTMIRGPDAYETFESGDELSYIGNSALKALGPGKQIIDTGWLPPSTLRENMAIAIVYSWDRDLQGGGAVPDKPFASSVYTYPSFLQGHIIRRNPKTGKEVSRVPITYTTDVNSNYVGARPTMNNQMAEATQFYTFDPKFEYKIELWTSSELEFNQYVIVDFMTLSYLEPNGWNTQEQHAFGSDPIHAPQNIITTVSFAIPTDGNGNGSAWIQNVLKAGASGADNYSRYFLNNILSAHVQMYDGSFYINSHAAGAADGGSMGTEVLSSALGFGYSLRIDILKGQPSTTLYGYVTIFGSVSPVEA